MNLTTAVEGKEYIIRAIEADDEEMEAFGDCIRQMREEERARYRA